MTKNQYDRWKDFALRMAKTAFKGQRRPGPRRILEMVKEFFDWVEDGCHAGDFYAWVPTIKDWDHNSPWSVVRQHYGRPESVCDFVADMAEQWVPNYWGVPDGRYEEVRDRWMGPATCCIRAGLDCASAPSAGVMGFTAGDLRRMYPEGVPDWVKGEPQWETIGVSKVIPGVGFVPEPKGDALAFDELPDEAEVWI